MANKMLIDAAHPEETRVVVVRGSRVEEFDFEAANKKQLRGNIYLAKVTRVEPSLQAAFVDYGGNRHGFLAFSEIHPDYYQIPVADRQALLEEEFESGDPDHGDEPASERDTADQPNADDKKGAKKAEQDAAAENDDDDGTETEIDDDVESVGAEDALEEVPERRRVSKRRYKIQEVIKRRQVLLVQVVKEERGNKGAALTTYLSLAGRYSVLMPNTARGGGISRKITNPADRKRLKEVAQDLDVADGMGVILRTAGASRTKSEVKRDFEYLLRLWESVRDLTLDSTAPMLVYEEGSLIKRSIRDLYNRDIAQVLVAGEDGYREAKDFMRMLMPSHAKNVQPYRDSTPVFTRNGVESQLDAMFSPQVTLRSGGYIVINQTEALVAIDVNSGKATREHSIEDTALQTNLEAADEIARQLRLRDLAGLIVIDFIDMEEKRNNKSVERRLKDCLKSDRARIQVGRISPFGLLEMSRQRIRTGVLEGSTEMCPVCQGAGIVRSTESVALHILRSLEDYLNKSVTHNLNVRTRTNVALYILNQKRHHLTELESRYGLIISVSADDSVNGQHYVVERGLPISETPERKVATVQPDSVQPDEEDQQAEEDQPAPPKRRRRRRRRRGGSSTASDVAEQAENLADADEATDRPAEPSPDSMTFAEVAESQEEPVAADQATEDGKTDTDGKKRRRRRGSRGGRSKRKSAESASEVVTDESSEPQPDAAAPEQKSTDAPAHEAIAEGVQVIDIATPADAAAADIVEPAPDAEAEEEKAVSEPGPAETIAEADTGSEVSEPEDDSLEPIALPSIPLVSEPAQNEAAPEPTAEAEKDADVNGTPQSTNGGEPLEETAGSTEEETAESEEGLPHDDEPKRSGWWQRKSFL